MNTKIEIKRIPLGEFIETLVGIYNSGIDFVSMVVEKGEHQDSICIVEDNFEKQKNEEDNKKTINFEELI